MNTKLIILFVLIGVSLVGWAVYGIQRLTTPDVTLEEINRAFPKGSYEAFLKSEKLTLFALNPEKAAEGAENLQGWAIVGKVPVPELRYQNELKAAFIREMARAKAAACFNPRHGLRAETDDGKTIDLIICFECNSFQVHYGSERANGAINKTYLEDPFNQILKISGIEPAQ